MTTITTTFYLDKRSKRSSGEFPLKITLTKDGSSTYIPLGVTLLPKQWDGIKKKIIGHPRRVFLNTYITQKKLEVDEIARDLEKKGLSHLSVTAIKHRIIETIKGVEAPKGTFASCMERYIERFQNSRTAEVYRATVRRMEAYSKKYNNLTFEDITVDWLTSFDRFLCETSPAKNARNIHFRNIRAVFNEARRMKITNEYPFGKGFFEIRPEKTRKRALPIEVLRSIFTAELEPWQEKYRDLFKLSFMLIGINYVDLYNLQNIVDGRIEYKRAKTGRLYSIRLEPEIQELLDTYSGTEHLLYMAEVYSSYRVGYMQLCKGLNSIKESLSLPELTTYWARHSWATIASSLGIQRDTIAHALGHGGDSVTDIYIDFDQAHVDEANRKVLDWVLYSKR